MIDPMTHTVSDEDVAQWVWFLAM